MNSQSKKIEVSYILLVVVLLGTGMFSWRVFFKEYHQHDTVNINQFPNKIDGWTSTDLPISEDSYAILETRNVFTRAYKHPQGKEAYLMLVYSQNNRKVSHPPEICYTGSGVSILSNESVQIPLSPAKLIEVNRLFVEQGGDQQIMYYWFKVGDTYTANYWKQQILIVLKTLLGKPASSALIRISVPVDIGGQPKAIETANEFVQVIAPHLLEYLP
jgi:EpsI family protein